MNNQTAVTKLEDINHDFKGTEFSYLNISVSRNYGYTSIRSQKREVWTITEKAHYLGVWGEKRTLFKAKIIREKYGRKRIERKKILIGSGRITFGLYDAKIEERTDGLIFLSKLPKKRK